MIVARMSRVLMVQSGTQAHATCRIDRFEWFRLPVEKPKWVLNCRCGKHSCLNKGAFFRTLRWASEGCAIMTTLQAICLGAMLAWTPSLIVLAWLLREAPLDELSCDPSSTYPDGEESLPSRPRTQFL